MIGISRPAAGDELWDVVVAAGPDGASPEEILTGTGFTRSQVEGAKAHIRDHKARGRRPAVYPVPRPVRRHPGSGQVRREPRSTRPSRRAADHARAEKPWLVH
jgi:hypothetical protein